MIRFVRMGDQPRNIYCNFTNMTVKDVLDQAGASVGGGTGATIDGRPADPSSPVKPGDTVAVQPLARNG